MPATMEMEPRTVPETRSATAESMALLADRALELNKEYHRIMGILKAYVAETGQPIAAPEGGEIFGFAPVVTYDFRMADVIPVLRRHYIRLADVATISKPMMDRLLAQPLMGDQLRSRIAENVSQRFDHRKQRR